MKVFRFAICFAALCLSMVGVGVAPAGTAFTYQGRLNRGTNAVNGFYDLAFTNFDALSGGTQVGPGIVTNAVSISNGTFTVTLDFGNIFNGNARWLQIAVRTNGGVFTNLTPRQNLTPTPYAISASSLSGLISASNLSGSYPNPVNFSNPGSSFSGNGGGLTNVNAFTLCGQPCNMFWNLLGNGGTTPGVNFLGTTDNQPLELKANNQRALRLEPNATSPNVIGGHKNNSVVPPAYGATIGGGGSSGRENVVSSLFASIGGGASNSVSGDYGTAGGGESNTIDGGDHAVINGGLGNYAYGSFETIGGGRWNLIQGLFGLTMRGRTIAGGSGNYIGGGNSLDGFSDFATISGGESNRVSTEASYAVISGGFSNFITSFTEACAIGGGSGNSIESLFSGSGPEYASISGGFANRIQATFGGPFAATIGGGESNLTAASYAVIPGGFANQATGQGSFAAGQHASAINDGAFVWADGSTTAAINSTNVDSVTMRAAGGYRLFSDSGATAGVQLAAGGGSWVSMSDRNAKQNFEDVNTRQVLEKVASLPMQTWNYKTQDPSIRHIGPMAQDFKAAFEVGETDTGITSVDADGVALAAIQGLNHKVEEQRAENAKLKDQVEELKNLVTALSNKINSGAK